MTLPDPLGLSRRCPRAGRCEVCDATRKLEATTYQTPVGVLCATVCDRYVAAGNTPLVRSWAGAVERVLAQCQHPGIDLDQMAALLPPDAEKGRSGDRLRSPSAALTRTSAPRWPPSPSLLPTPHRPGRSRPHHRPIGDRMDPSHLEPCHRLRLHKEQGAKAAFTALPGGDPAILSASPG
jgi:hypothetical protein